MSSNAWRALLLIGGIAAALGSGIASTASAQVPPPEFEPIPPLRAAVSLLLTTEPVVTVSYAGEYGAMRVTGTLTGAPEAPLRIVRSEGQQREVHWNDLASLQIVRVPTAELPVGTFTVRLSSESGVLPRSGVAASAGDYTEVEVINETLFSTPLRVARLPRAELTLEGEPYKSIRVPTERITDFRMVPIRGSLTQAMEGVLGLDVGGGESNGNARSSAAPKVVDIPLDRIETVRRDVDLRLATVTLNDGQTFTGRVVRLPRATLTLDVDGKSVSYPLERIAQLEVTNPVVSR